MRLAKNKQISTKGKETRLRHSNMVLKCYEVKIQENKLNIRQKDALQTIFLEAKWFKNYVLNWLNEDNERKISDFNTKQKEITKKDKDMNEVTVAIRYLSAQSRQCIISRMRENLKTLATLKRKGLQPVIYNNEI